MIGRLATYKALLLACVKGDFKRGAQHHQENKYGSDTASALKIVGPVREERPYDNLYRVKSQRKDPVDRIKLLYLIKLRLVLLVKNSRAVFSLDAFATQVIHHHLEHLSSLKNYYYL